MINNKYINKKFKGGADDIVNQEERFLYNKRIYFLYKNVLDELKNSNESLSTRIQNQSLVLSTSNQDTANQYDNILLIKKKKFNEIIHQRSYYYDYINSWFIFNSTNVKNEIIKKKNILNNIIIHVNEKFNIKISNEEDFDKFISELKLNDILFTNFKEIQNNINIYFNQINSTDSCIFIRQILDNFYNYTKYNIFMKLLKMIYLESLIKIMNNNSKYSGDLCIEPAIKITQNEKKMITNLYQNDQTNLANIKWYIDLLNQYTYDDNLIESIIVVEKYDKNLADKIIVNYLDFSIQNLDEPQNEPQNEA